MGTTLDTAIRAAAARLANSTTPMLDARVLGQRVTGFSHEQLIANGPAPLSPDQLAHFENLIARRETGEPIAYILGTREFWGDDYIVTPDVLIPRADSETLITAAQNRRRDPGRILDLGTGSGCLLGAMMRVFPVALGMGVDRVGAAAQIARRNMAKLRLTDRTQIIIGSWLDAVAGPFDIIVSNPPYISPAQAETLPVDVRGFEPASALFSDKEGRADYEALFAGMGPALAPDGLLVIEIGDGQDDFLVDAARAAFSGAACAVEPDLAGLPRALVVDCATR
ncbi:MAG: peptide chain release factor N(5)-glutamine methyltransferase [Pseudomonadota bacterium]